MSNPQILNLDDVSAEDEKVLRLDGVEHKAVEMTVEGYIERVKRARSANIEASDVDKIAETIEFLRDVYPTVGEDRFRKLSLAQLTKVIDFTISAPKDIADAVVKNQAGPEGNA